MNCGLCGHKITKECNAGGYYQKTDDGEIDIKLCHPDYPSDDHKDCYHLYTVYGTRSIERDQFLDELVKNSIELNLYELTKDLLPPKETK